MMERIERIDEKIVAVRAAINAIHTINTLVSHGPDKGVLTALSELQVDLADLKFEQEHASEFF